MIRLAILFLTLLCTKPLFSEEDARADKLSELSEVLGRTHAIHVICNGRSDQFWRIQMTRMLDIETPEEDEKRSSLVRAFNDAFEAQNKSVTMCSEAAKSEFTELAREGQRLSEELNTIASNSNTSQ